VITAALSRGKKSKTDGPQNQLLEMAIKGKAQLTFQLWSKKLNSGGLKHYKRFKEKSVKLILYKYIQVREAIRDDGK